MKLELKHLAPYLPYGLEIRSSEGSTKIMGYKVVNGERIYQLDTNDDSGDFAFDDPIKPILRPLSDLTKEIDVNGEKFIPLVKLFYMLDSSNYVDFDGEITSDYELSIDDGWNHCLQFTYGENELCFSYGEDSFMLVVANTFNNMQSMDAQFVTRQLELFNKLFEWHFDVFDLHSKNLCIYYDELNK